jgi:hypothetical protein
LDDSIEFAEVQFFFRARIEEEDKTLALVSLYSEPDAELLEESYNTVWSCKYQGDDKLEVVDAKSISSVVAMVPLPIDDNEGSSSGDDRDSDDISYFVVEKLGLDVSSMAGYKDDEDEEDILEEADDGE